MAKQMLFELGKPLKTKEALINCEKRINRMPPINPLSFDKLPYNHNLRQLEKVAGTAVKCSA